MRELVVVWQYYKLISWFLGISFVFAVDDIRKMFFKGKDLSLVVSDFHFWDWLVESECWLVESECWSVSSNSPAGTRGIVSTLEQRHCNVKTFYRRGSIHLSFNIYLDWRKLWKIEEEKDLHARNSFIRNFYGNNILDICHLRVSCYPTRKHQCLWVFDWCLSWWLANTCSKITCVQSV